MVGKISASTPNFSATPARLTDAKLEIDEYTKEELNRRILYINENINLSPEVSITYFVPDSKKTGGA